MRCTRLLGVAALAVPLAVPGAPEAASSGWCEFGQRPGETFPAPRLNLPAWVCESASAAKLHAKYTIYSGINPFFLAGDFNGDGRLGASCRRARSWTRDTRRNVSG